MLGADEGTRLDLGAAEGKTAMELITAVKLRGVAELVRYGAMRQRAMRQVS